ncbi:uncharacterized protein LOC108909304 isoform X1 [Anoplophora glabripennis]|uniref:uncharacterized protein LOC108909304 isoform X1 n=2 Tax=Anoplophora glabripennis TaxID=217634 RepID=UPI0008758841|nr:uncharacterized protein LOC108909304 isoform X1 [Anoplophora glabripennis]
MYLLTNACEFNRNIHHQVNFAWILEMSECHNELLMNIPDEDLEKLADMYKEHGEIPYASSVLTNGIRVRKKRSFFIRFMSPGNCWKDDGTFFALMEFPHSYDLAIFTLDKTCKNVYEGLTRTKRLHFERPLIFYAVHNIVYPTVLKIVQEKNLQVETDNAYYIFTVSKEKALEFNIDCPEEVVLRKLTPAHSTTVDKHWPHNFAHSQEFLSSLIELVGGWGLFLKSNNELVTWGLLTGLGQLGMIQTVESYQKRGYASVITKVLSKKIAERDEDPVGTVAVKNVASQNMFEKLGFENKGQCNYVNLKKII